MCDTSTGVFTIPQRGLYAIKMSLCITEAAPACVDADVALFTLTLVNAQGDSTAVMAPGITASSSLQCLTIALNAEKEFHAGDSFYFTLTWNDGASIQSVQLCDAEAAQTTFASVRQVPRAEPF